MPARAYLLEPQPPGLAGLLDAVRNLLRAEQAGTEVRAPRPPAAARRAARVPSLRPPSSGRPDESDGEEVWALVARAQRGEREAFGELYDHYVAAVFRYVRFRVGDSTLAEDLTSETFLRALRSIGTVSRRGHDFRAWLVTIARNVVIDHVKSARYRLEISTADLLEPGHVEGPEGAVLDRIVSQTLVGAVRQLTDDQQECIALRFLQGMSVAETAQIMGRNEGAVKVLQFRAIRALGRLLPAGLLR